MSSPPRQPPRFVPTLTEVVALPADTMPQAEAAANLQDDIVDRVMRRVDLSLERRLREAIGALVLEQTQNMAPRLRVEIEILVRECVAAALASEFPSPH